MFRNYLKAAFRNIKRNKGYSFINIMGLAVGMAAGLLLMIFVRSELGVDDYHVKGDRIYRMNAHFTVSGNEYTWPASNGVIAPVLERDYPEVERAARFHRMRTAAVRYGDKQFREIGFVYTDPSILEIFSWPLVAGDPRRALKAPFSIVLSEDTAKNYFGDQDPLGKTLRVNNTDDYTVTGVMKNIPRDASYPYDALCSFSTLHSTYDPRSPLMTSWILYNFHTMVLLEPGADYRELEKKFPALLEKYAGDEMRKKGVISEFFLQPLKEMRLYGPRGDLNGPILYIYIIVAAALFVLLIACANFMNLSTARSAHRALEVGVRKVLGAGRNELIFQFFLDALLLTSIAMGLALLLVELGLPLIGSLIQRPLSIASAGLSWFIPLVAGVTLITGLLSGSYPALFLSSFQPVNVLSGYLKTGLSHSRLRHILVTVQFSISIILVTGTALLVNQLDYMKTKDPGFNKEHTVALPTMNEEVQKMLPVLKEELKRDHKVAHTAAVSIIPGQIPALSDTLPEGYADDSVMAMQDINTDPEFIPAMEIKMIAGRNFKATGEPDAVIINETAIKQLGWEKPLGKTINVKSESDPDAWSPRKVIGVIEDFHIAPLEMLIQPLILRNAPGDRYIVLRGILVRIKPGDQADTMAHIERTWTRLFPHTPFLAMPVDTYYQRQFRQLEGMMNTFSYFAVLAVFIASLGLFGTAWFTAERRTREIGIRKALGAQSSGIALMLLKEFAGLVLTANIIAWPVTYIVMNQWLKKFPYRAEIGIGTFIFTGLAALVIALLTVGYQSIRAAATNPAEALKYE